MRKGYVTRYSGHYSFRSRRKKWPIVVLIILIALVVAATAGAYYYQTHLEKSSQDTTPTISPTEMAAVPTPTEIPAPTPTSAVASGAFGAWDKIGTPTPIINNYDVEGVWMANWKDTRTPVDVKGIYITPNFTANMSSDAERIRAIDNLLALVDRTELNAMVIDVKYDSGAILYDFDSEIIDSYETEDMQITVEKLGFLDEYIKKLHEHGVYVIARLVAFKDSKIAIVRPDLAIYNADGTLYMDAKNNYWLSPYKTEVWEYLAEVGKQCALLGFDEINFDYIRFPTERTSNIVWSAEDRAIPRKQAIASGVRFLSESLRPYGVFVSANVLATVIVSEDIDGESTGQDYVRMARYLDYICPMAYPSHYGNSWYGISNPVKHPYETVYKTLAYGVNSLSAIHEPNKKADVRPWLQDFDYVASEVRAQIDATYDNGYKSWMLWNARGVFTEGALEKE